MVKAVQVAKVVKVIIITKRNKSNEVELIHYIIKI